VPPAICPTRPGCASHKYLQIKARHLGIPANELPDLDKLKTVFARENTA
jgi:hypothetical protein